MGIVSEPTKIRTYPPIGREQLFFVCCFAGEAQPLSYQEDAWPYSRVLRDMSEYGTRCVGQVTKLSVNRNGLCEYHHMITVVNSGASRQSNVVPVLWTALRSTVGRSPTCWLSNQNTILTDQSSETKKKPVIHGEHAPHEH